MKKNLIITIVVALFVGALAFYGGLMYSAKKNSALVSLDLSDTQLIRRNKKLFSSIVKEHIDIVFANEEEATAFSGKKNSRKALHEIAKSCRCVCDFPWDGAFVCGQRKRSALVCVFKTTGLRLFLPCSPYAGETGGCRHGLCYLSWSHR